MAGVIVRQRFLIVYGFLIQVTILGIVLLLTFLYWKPVDPATTTNGARTKPITNTTKPITNTTMPNDIESHFAEGKEYSQAPATGIGMRDGTCYVYTNQVSWLAMECFGTVR